jgi:hypothetical protein
MSACFRLSVLVFLIGSGLCALAACDSKSDCEAFCDRKQECAEPKGSFDDLASACVDACVRVDSDNLDDSQERALTCLSDTDSCESFNRCLSAIQSGS